MRQKYMNGDKSENSIRKIILEKIQNGEIKMRPRYYFILRFILLISAVCLSFILVIFFTSFIRFVLSITGASFLPSFGWPGAIALFAAFPWPILLVVIIFLFISAILFKQFAPIYHRPAIFGITGILLIFFIGSLVLHRIRLHEQIFELASGNKIFFINPMYNSYRQMPPSSHSVIGEVASTTETGFLIKNEDDQIFHIFITPRTFFPSGRDIKENDTLLILGDERDNAINAKGIKRIKPDEDVFFSGHQKFIIRQKPPQMPPRQPDSQP
jgi:hypothetical protein